MIVYCVVFDGARSGVRLAMCKFFERTDAEMWAKKTNESLGDATYSVVPVEEPATEWLIN